YVRDAPAPSVALLRCITCSTPLAGVTAEPFCDQHARELATRRQEGVPALELDARWSDTLANWRDCPAGLAVEPDAGGWRLLGRRAGWLLFARSSAGRRPDALAIQDASGEVRQFADADLQQVLDNREGRPPSPAEVRDPLRWRQCGALYPLQGPNAARSVS